MKLNLTSQQLMFLKLYALNKSTSEIREFLDISSNRLGYIKKQLRLKFYTNCYIDIIVACIENGFIKKLDLLDESVKTLCYNYIQTNSLDNFINIENYVLSFYKHLTEYNNELYSNNNKALKLSKNEVAFLENEYKGQIIKDDDNGSTLSYREYIGFKSKIFRKLKTNNFFNAFKTAYLYRLIKIDDAAEISIIKKLINDSVVLKKIKTNKNLLDKALLYEEMLKVLYELEYTTLWEIKTLKENKEAIQTLNLSLK